MSLQIKIKQTLRILNYALTQIPGEKQGLIAPKVDKALKDFQRSLDNEKTQAKLLQDLEFNLNFMKLSHPQVNYDELPQEESQNVSKQQQDKEKAQESEKQDKIQQNFFKLENQEELMSQMRQAKVPREEVDFSNWWEGNLDPQHIRRHKNLLLRQHFSGDFWQDKSKPNLTAEKVMASAMATGTKFFEGQKQVKKPEPEEMAYDPEKRWIKVKR